jgi:rfaE bifunctional protein nucleotidyltransferase chain/domain
MMDGAEKPTARSARDKLCTLEGLAAIAETARAAGETVVLCHGVFDLVHMGHVRHLEAARREGTMLLVTVTADKFVGKGPGRPIFPQELRAEMLAAVQYVDSVAINHAPSAENVLRAIKPDVYVKGSDYENPEEDVTGGIARERSAVESHGGRLVFTRDITFSSSSLINQYLDVYDPSLRDHLDALRAKSGLESILRLIEKVKDYRVLVVGDTIVDEYQYVAPLGKSAKENMIATLFDSREVFAGGVIAAANHLAGLCKEVEILTCLGGEDSHEKLVRESVKPNVRLDLMRRDGVPTTRKCRFVERGYLRKLFEVYFMDDSPLPTALAAELDRRIAAHARDYDLVVVTDFGHGFIGPSTVKALTDNSRFLAVNAQSNSANTGFNLITKYPRADYISIDAPEARLAAADKHGDLAAVAAETLPARIACDRMILTHGSNGCVSWDRANGTVRIPAFTKTVVDTVGAGDAFFAVTAPLAAAGGAMDHVGFVGNAAGAIKVGIVGHRQSVEKAALVKYITALLK